MRRALLSILACIGFFFTTNCQTNFRFADSSSQWNVLAGWWSGNDPQPWVYSTEIFTVGGDTVINNLSFQIIQRTNGDTTWETYLRRDSLNRIYAYFGQNNFWNDSINNLIYDFGGQVGDTFTSYWGNTMVISNIDTVFWDKPRRRFIYTNYGDTFPYRTVVEGMGVMDDNFLMPYEDYIPEAWDPIILCFSVNNSVYYHDTTYDTIFASCYVTGINEDQTLAAGIFPNPVTYNLIVVKLSQFPRLQTVFEVYDITGRIVIQKMLTGETNSINIANMSAGIYTYSITSQHEKIGTGKLIIE